MAKSTVLKKRGKDNNNYVVLIDGLRKVIAKRNLQNKFNTTMIS